MFQMCFFFFIYYDFVQRESGAYTINMEKMDYLDKMNALIDLDATIMMTLTLDLYSVHPTKCLENFLALIHHLQNYSVTVRIFCILETDFMLFDTTTTAKIKLHLFSDV